MHIIQLLILEALVVCASLAGFVFYTKRPHEVESLGTGITGIAGNCFLFKHHSLKKTCAVRSSDFGSSFVMLSVFGVIYYCISQAIPLRYL